MPFQSLGLWDAVMMAPPSRSFFAEKKYIMSVPTQPMSITAAPWERAPRMKPAVISGDERRASCPTAMRFAPR